MKVKKIKFSIVMPSFNCEEHIERAIQSIVSQSYQDFELIAIDGGSVDGTRSILKKYSKHFTHTVSEPDRGQSDAFNKGFNLAQGDFLFWLNADDILLPDTLLRAAQHLNLNPECKWLTFDTIFIDVDERVKFFYRGPTWNQFLIKRRGPQVDSPTSIFHRSMFLNSQGFDLRLRYAMDIEMWYQFLKLGHKWQRVRHYSYAFRMHENSKTGSDGYGAKPTQEKLVQGQLIAEKYNIEHSRWANMLSRIIKCFYSKPTAVVDGLRWRGKKLNEYSSSRG